MEDKTGKTLGMAFGHYGVPILAAALLAGGAWLWGYHRGRASAGGSLRDTCVVVRTDTAFMAAPVASSSGRAGVVAVPVRVALEAPAEPADLPGDTILVFAPATSQDGDGTGDTATLRGLPAPAFPDTLRAVVPLTQKEYRDSNFTAYVSGFMPRLDSIEVRSRTITIRQTVTKYHTFNVGLTGGVGYGLFNKKPDVFVGVGATLRIFKK